MMEAGARHALLLAGNDILGGIELRLSFVSLMSAIA